MNKPNSIGLSLLISLIVLVGNDLVACSVPVFRYALERWTPDSYGVIVFHQGALSKEHQNLVDRLDPTKLPSDQFVNFSVTTVDLAEVSEPEAIELWKAQETEVVPWMMISFPWSRLASESVWAGPLTEVNVARIVDSPIRREIARRLVQGDSAVWVLLESGNPEQDDQAQERLDSRLQHLTSTLELPVLNPSDIEEGLISIGEDQLKIAFSTIRLSRLDPAEEFFVKMLLGSEDDLAEFDEPIAFPIFGRGRVLYGLVGQGIAAEVIDEACVFLTGACSCEVKEQNPGVDLVMSVDWDRLVTSQSDIDRDLPPLAGFVGMGEELQGEERSGERVALGEAEGVRPEPSSEKPGKELGVRSVVSNAVLLCGFLGFVAFGVGVYLLRRRTDAC